MSTKPTASERAKLADLYFQDVPEEGDAHGIRWEDLETWEPRLNPVQKEVYESDAAYILADGERGSGKTIGLLHKLVHHCVNYPNARAGIIVGVRRQASEGGAWDKLEHDVLPTWKFGNRDRQGVLTDAGINLEFTETKSNVSKDTFLYIANRHNGWSKVLLLSMPVEGHIRDRVKGIECSFILVDEAQTLESDAYFSTLSMQVGRLKGIPGHAQQLCYAANPEGPSHWLYKRFFEMPVGEDGEWNEAYARFHVPIEENLDNLPDGYYDKVIEAVRGDEIEFQRLVRGVWIDRPTTGALFKDDWNAGRHLRGNAAKNIGLIPFSEWPMVLGWDLGTRHSSIHLMQFVALPNVNREIFCFVIDEINTVGAYEPYRLLVPRVLKRMDYWNETCGGGLKFQHISDDSAFNQYRAAKGSFDAKDVEELSGGRIKMIPAPKGPASVMARSRELKDRLQLDLIRVSAICTKTVQMFLRLEEDKKNPGCPARSQYLHPFDSLTYPMLYYSLKRVQDEKNTGRVKPEVYAIGGRGRSVAAQKREARVPQPPGFEPVHA